MMPHNYSSHTSDVELSKKETDRKSSCFSTTIADVVNDSGGVSRMILRCFRSMPIVPSMFIQYKLQTIEPSYYA